MSVWRRIVATVIMARCDAVSSIMLAPRAIESFMAAVLPVPGGAVDPI